MIRPRRRGRQSLRDVAVVLAVLALAGCAPATQSLRPAAMVRADVAPTADPPSATIGVADSDLYGLPRDRVDKSMALMRSVGVTSVRLMIPWAGVQHTPDSYDWSTVDLMVDSAVAHHMSVLATLNSPPGWAVIPGQQPIVGRPASPAAYGRFAGKAAEHFRGKVAAYEIWNEPNAAMFYAPAPDPAGYADLLKAAYPAIKAADGSAVVVAAGLGSTVDHSTLSMNPIKFVRGMYAAGAKTFFDALAFHPYQYTMQFSETWHPDAPLNQLAAIRRLMVVNGDAKKTIWATEYGEPSSVVGEAQQAEYLEDMLTTWRTLSYAGPVFLDTLRDRKSLSSNPDDTLGLYRSDGTPKPVVAVLSSHTRGHALPVQQASEAPR